MAMLSPDEADYQRFIEEQRDLNGAKDKKYPFEDVFLDKRKCEAGRKTDRPLTFHRHRVWRGISVVRFRVAAILSEDDPVDSKDRAFRKRVSQSRRVRSPANKDEWISQAKEARARSRNGEAVLSENADERVKTKNEEIFRVSMALKYLVDKAAEIVNKRAEDGSGTLIFEDVFMMLDAIFQFEDKNMANLQKNTDGVFGELYLRLLMIDKSRREIGNEGVDIRGMVDSLSPLLNKINLIARGGLLQTNEVVKGPPRATDYLVRNTERQFDGY